MNLTSLMVEINHIIIPAEGIAFYADPYRTLPSEMNDLYGGRGVYFDDPNGHQMELITTPYGDASEFRFQAAAR